MIIAIDTQNASSPEAKPCMARAKKHGKSSLATPIFRHLRALEDATTAVWAA